MRVLLSIDENWIVTVGAGLAKRYLTKAPDGDLGIVPLPDPSKHDALISLAAMDGPAVLAVYGRLMSRNLKAGDADSFGRYLFDCALGADWKAVTDEAEKEGAWFIEIALSWNAEDSALSRLPWELMRSNEGYLCNGYMRRDPGRNVDRHIDIAITRVVPGSTGVPRQIDGLPKVLFAVGTSLTDPSVRPAAEILCMLKRTRECQRRMHPRMIEKASPSRIESAIATFNPDVVHLLCHGGIKGGVPYLELQAETGGGQEQVTAEQLAGKLQAGGSAPPIVLLSACQSGTSMLGPQAAAPFAAQLVRFGIPVVVGMSGKVSDIACRLFTRRFAESLLGAEPLVQATAEGRRAAFTEGKAPEKSIDWAFPAVFLSAKVDPDYMPANPDGPDDDIEIRIRAYLTRKDPAFCGRQDFFQEFETLFRPHGPAVLAAFTDDAHEGYGRKRLLEELTVQAILEGHVPCLVTSLTWNEKPTTPLALALEIDRAADIAAKAFDVKLRPKSPAQRLRAYAVSNYRSDKLSEFDEEMQVLLAETPMDISGPAAMRAIEQRLTELIALVRLRSRERLEEALAKASADPNDLRLRRIAAHAQAEADRTASARVVVLLDSIQLYDKAGKAMLAHPGLGDTGLGTRLDPVPVVVTFSLRDTATTVLDPIVQNQSSRPGWRFLPLKPFEKNGENLLAWARVLLTPFAGDFLPGVSDKAWVMDDTVDAKVRETQISNFNLALKGYPGEFLQLPFFLLALTASQQSFLKVADDDNIVAGMIKERMRFTQGRP